MGREEIRFPVYKKRRPQKRLVLRMIYRKALGVETLPFKKLIYLLSIYFFPSSTFFPRTSKIEFRKTDIGKFQHTKEIYTWAENIQIKWGSSDLEIFRKKIILRMWQNVKVYITGFDKMNPSRDPLHSPR